MGDLVFMVIRDAYGSVQVTLEAAAAGRLSLPEICAVLARALAIALLYRRLVIRNQPMQRAKQRPQSNSFRTKASSKLSARSKIGH